MWHLWFRCTFLYLYFRPRAPSRRPPVPSAWRPRGQGRDSVPGPEGASNERLQTPFNNKHKLKINNSLIYSYALTRIFNHVSYGFLFIPARYTIPVYNPPICVPYVYFCSFLRAVWHMRRSSNASHVDFCSFLRPVGDPRGLTLTSVDWPSDAEICSFRDVDAGTMQTAWIFTHSCAVDSSRV